MSFTHQVLGSSAAPFIDVATETPITGTFNVPNVYPAAFAISGNAGATAYNIFLDATAPVGSLLYFRVLRTATQVYTLYAGGLDFDGIDRRLLMAGEAAMIMKVAAGWTVIGNRPRPVAGTMRASAQQSMAIGAWTPVAFTSGNGLGFTAPEFKAPRPGLYKFTANLAVNGILAGGYSHATFNVAGQGGPGGASADTIVVSTKEGVTGRCSHMISGQYNLGTGQTCGVIALASTAGAYVEYAAGILVASLSYEEVVTW